MDETKYVAVSQRNLDYLQSHASVRVRLATDHVAVKRELLERALNYISPSSSGHSDEVARELRNLLSQKGE